MALVPSGSAQLPLNDPPLQAQRFSRAWLDFFQALASQSAAGAGADLPLAGGAMTGALLLSGAPTAALQAATKAYVDAAAAAAAAAGSTYAFTQPAPLAVWTIAHNLGRFPSVSVVDSAGTEIEGSVVYTNANQVVITFSSAFAGAAYLN